MAKRTTPAEATQVAKVTEDPLYKFQKGGFILMQPIHGGFKYVGYVADIENAEGFVEGPQPYGYPDSIFLMPVGGAFFFVADSKQPILNVGN